MTAMTDADAVASLTVTSLGAIEGPRRWYKLAPFIAPAVPIGATGIPLSLFLPPYYSTYVGMSLATVGLCFLIVRLLDIAFDPVMGLMLDRTHTRWGQCRPWLAAGTALVSMATLWLFLAGKGTSPIALIGGLLVFYAGTSIMGVAHPAWAARLFHDYHDRSRVYAWMSMAAAVGTFLVLGGPTLIGAFGHPKPGDNVHAMGWGIAIAAPLALLAALITTPEPPPGQQHGVQARARLSDYIALIRIGAIRRLVIADALTAIGVGTSTSLFFFFWRSRGVSAGHTSVLVLTYLLATLLTIPVWMAVAKRIGKHRALIASLCGFILVIPGMGLLPADQMAILVPAIALLGMTFSGQFLIRAMAADAADVARLQTGRDRLGQVYALLTSTAKAGPALAVGASYGILDAVGFKSNDGAVNTPAALDTLWILYLGFPALMMLIGALAFVGYKLDGTEHTRVLRALAERDAAAKPQLSDLNAGVLGTAASPAERDRANNRPR